MNYYLELHFISSDIFEFVVLTVFSFKSSASPSKIKAFLKPSKAVLQISYDLVLSQSIKTESS